MTDAALGGPRPIKSEHSYSLLTSSPPPSPATPGANPHTPNSGSSSDTVGASLSNTSSSIDPSAMDHHKSLDIRSRIDDMEEECFPAISMNTASGRGELSSSSSSSLSPSSTSTVILKTPNDLVPEDVECAEIKGEPLSAPSSPSASCQTTIVDDKSTITMVFPQSLHFSKNHLSQTSDSEEDDEEYYQAMEVEDYDGTVCVSKEANSRTSRQGLPPTPPSSASSDSEGTASASCSPERRDSQSSAHPQNLRGLLTPRLYVTNGAHTTRQPIHTPLISCQPKGSTGNLTLTEEEKRTLIAEGYPVPTKLPLTKQEEKSLKKVRRKIKNKISAQESRRKKKEYMDGLERRVTLLTNENSSYRDRLTVLEDTNRELLKELQRLQAMLQLQVS
ncbi:cyclic AMP response element-binding protein A-like [Hylaeus anthracinus]|nr:cyclic AMP response element-binding protein A-like [Hylaeus anthracinus]XP_054009297.1 cyclic AMP response element-binding protein A-like [Hylaeus anthracinus]XP_054009300.1 cyclic AMP response element-binding protein A-like [Hylaeus anthracinus]XP_054009301.1 cyclic AMP response element-binding protein A-like [Hylaeus anthracinus]